MKYDFADIRNARGMVLFVLGLTLCMIIYIDCFLIYAGRHAIDFYQFWVVGQAIHQPETGNIYSTEERIRLGSRYYEKAAQLSLNGQIPLRQFEVAKLRQTLETYSTPLLYTFFGLIATGDYNHDFNNYRILIFIILAIVLFGLAIIFKLSIFEFFLLFPLLTYYYFPFMADIEVLNVNIIQLGLLGIFSFFYRYNYLFSKILSGMTIGILIAFKPNMVLPIFFLLFGIIVDKKYFTLKQLLMGILLGGIAAIGISALWINHLRAWIDWFGSKKELISSIHPFVRYNFSIYQLAEDLLGKRLSQILSVILISIGLTIIWIKRDQNTIDKNNFFDRDVARLGIGCAISLLATGICWHHYYLLLLPFLLFLFHDSKYSINILNFSGIFICLSFFSIIPRYVLTFKDIPYFQGLSFIIGTLLLIILLYKELDTI
jgi:hypothetical protein